MIALLAGILLLVPMTALAADANASPAAPENVPSAPATGQGSAQGAEGSIVAEAPQANPIDEALRLRDPFKRPELEIAKGVPRTELEYYSLDTFKMVGILTGPSKLRAMLRTPDGRTFLVQSGMKIGTRNGVIQRITEDAVRVRERILNVLGREENIDTEIPLQADPRASRMIITGG